MNAITIDGLTKRYGGGKDALTGVSLALEEGEIFGFLGPNGAGKTTTVKLLTGLLTPTGGGSRVLTFDPVTQPEKVHGVSGVVTEHAQMYDNMTGLGNLLFFGAAFGLERADCRTRAQSLLAQLELEDAADKKLGAYSTGMRQRLSLCRALLHRPKVLFLDEPTSGLDPEHVLKVNGMLRRLAREEGVTVFLCTHQLRYAQEICTRYGLLDNGRLLATGMLESLRAQVGDTAAVKLKADRVPPSLGAQALAEGWYQCPISGEEDIPPLVQAVVQGGGHVYRVEAEAPTLEDIYFALTAKGEEAAR